MTSIKNADDNFAELQLDELGLAKAGDAGRQAVARADASIMMDLPQSVLVIVRAIERAADSCKKRWPRTTAAPPIANRADRIASIIEDGRTRYGNAPVGHLAEQF
jgi:hypothetical protein